ncbi:MAG: VIT1/CCC1 transporter family protein, partial [Nocardioidaceae bacterium]
IDDLASPMLAAGSSFVSFAVGAVLPLLPFLLGASAVWPAVGLSLIALFGCGAVVTSVTRRPWWFGGIRQLVLGGLAALLTYFVGTLVGAAGL